MAINVGNMRQEVTWEQGTPVVQPAGEEITVWTPIGTYWARVEPLGEREQFYAHQIVATADFRITMRNVGTITSEDRLVFIDPNGVTLNLNINNVICVDNRNEFYEILATSEVAP